MIPFTLLRTPAPRGDSPPPPRFARISRMDGGSTTGGDSPFVARSRADAPLSRTVGTRRLCRPVTHGYRPSSSTLPEVTFPARFPPAVRRAADAPCDSSRFPGWMAAAPNGDSQRLSGEGRAARGRERRTRMTFHSHQNMATNTSLTRDELASILECPVCFNICTPQFWQCPQGHITCNTCLSRVHHCPICRDPIS